MDNKRSCKEMMTFISDYIDGTLENDLCAELERHLWECKNCQIAVDTTRMTIELYQRCSFDQASLPEDVRIRLFHRLDLKDYIDNTNKK